MEFEVNIELTCHPETPGPEVQGLWACVRRSRSLDLVFELRGNLAHLNIPKPGPKRFDEKLWEHTCFEVFVGLKGEEGYHEFNVSPSGAWAAFVFQRRRERIEDACTLEPISTIDGSETQLRVKLQIPLEALSVKHPHAALRIGLSVIVEDAAGDRSFWALHHPPGRPDFHHPEAFALVLPEWMDGTNAG